jgi:hypothetical protein
MNYRVFQKKSKHRNDCQGFHPCESPGRQPKFLPAKGMKRGGVGVSQNNQLQLNQDLKIINPSKGQFSKYVKRGMIKF